MLRFTLLALVGAAAAEFVPSLQSKGGALVMNVDESAGVNIVKRNTAGEVTGSETVATASSVEYLEETLFGAKRSARSGNATDEASPAGGLVGATIAQNTVLSDSLGSIEHVTRSAGDAQASAQRFNAVPYIFGVTILTEPNADGTIGTESAVVLQVIGRNFFTLDGAMGCSVKFGRRDVQGVVDTTGATTSEYNCTIPSIPADLIGELNTVATVTATFLGLPTDRYKTATDVSINYLAAAPTLTAPDAVPAGGGDDVGFGLWTDPPPGPAADIYFMTDAVEADGNMATFAINIGAGASTLSELKSAVRYTHSNTTTNSPIAGVTFNDNNNASDGNVHTVWVEFTQGAPVPGGAFKITIEVEDGSIPGVAVASLTVTIGTKVPYAGFVEGRECNDHRGWGCDQNTVYTTNCFDGSSANQPKFVDRVFTNGVPNCDESFMVGLPDNAVREGWIRLVFDNPTNPQTPTNIHMRKSENAIQWDKVNSCNHNFAFDRAPLLAGAAGSVRDVTGNQIVPLDTTSDGSYLQVTKAWGRWKYFLVGMQCAWDKVAEIAWVPRGEAPFEL